MMGSFTIPSWLTWLIPGARKRWAEMERRPNTTGIVRSTASRSWLGRGIEIEVTYELEDMPEDGKKKA